MNPEIVFSIANTVTLIAWLLLIIAPVWKWTQRIVVSGIISLLLSLAYLTLIILFFGQAEGGFGSLAEVMKLFTNQWAALAGWIHYLAFDLFIGSWEVKNARARGISHWLVIPCLILTFMLGPLGFLLYHLLRRFVTGKKSEEEIKAA